MRRKSEKKKRKRKKLIYIRLENDLIRNCILSDCPFDFARIKSTLNQQLSCLTNHIKDAFDDNEFAVAISRDLPEAFDTAKHSILLSKP